MGVADAGSTGFSTMHVRRGDLQFKEVKVEAEMLLKAISPYVRKSETLYISTDEKDLNFFAPFRREGYPIKTLQDYYERAGLKGTNQNYIGMIESIVAAHGRTFTGTFKSSFTAYIYRLRMYYGKPAESNFYHTPGKETILHDLETNMSGYDLWMREWPLCCRDIDATRVPHANVGLQAVRHQWPTEAVRHRVTNGHGVTCYSGEAC